MPNAIPFPCPLARFREYAISALVPFFLDDASDEAQALLVARQTLEGYEAHSPIEIQFSAQVIATTIATLACLRTAIAARKLSLGQRLALQDVALTLEKQGAAAKKVLDACRQRRPSVAAVRWDDNLFQSVLGGALRHLRSANAIFAANPAVITMKPVAIMHPPNQIGVKQPKLVFDCAEPMTQAILGKRAAIPRTRRRPSRRDT